MNSVFITSFSDSVTNGVVLYGIEYTMPGGKCGAWASITCLICLATSSALASGCRKIPISAAGMSSFGAADRVVGGGELDAGDVLEAHHLAVAGFADDDVLEFGGAGQTALDEHRVLHLLPLGNGRQAEAAGGRDDVLLADDAGDVGCGDAEPRHALRVEPDAHAVVARAEDANLPDAGHPAQRVVQVEQRVVAQEYGVVACAPAT